MHRLSTRARTLWTPLLAVALLAACTSTAETPDEPRQGDSAAPASTSSPPRSVTLVATGDVLVHQAGSLVDGARRGDGYDFSAVLAPVAGILQTADLAICHLETPIAASGGPYRGYPSFAVQPEIIEALAGAGYDLCSTASNHSLDDGFDGLVRTLEGLDAAGLAHSGTARTAIEDVRPTVVEAGGVQVGHVSVTFSLNGVPRPPGKEWSVDVFDPPDMGGALADAARARAAGAEVVVVSLHCCTEYEAEPTAEQEAAVRTLLASPDVDLVLGHHAHVVQPLELVDGEWAVYGLGNHIAQQGLRGYPTEDSVIARFTFTEGPDGRFAATVAEAVPTRIDLGEDAVQVLPADPAARDRITAVLDLRGALGAGLRIASA